MSEDNCYLDDDGLSPEVHVVEAGEDPQALCVRVGPVFYPDGQGKDPGIWIEYQEHYMRGPLTGPVLLTPEVWRQLNRSVERRLRRKMSLRKRIRLRISQHEDLFTLLWCLHLVKNEDPES